MAIHVMLEYAFKATCARLTGSTVHEARISPDPIGAGSTSIVDALILLCREFVAVTN